MGMPENDAIRERVFQEIVVEYPSRCVHPEYKGKPYFSIKYTENGQGYIGYGTYKPEVLSEFLKDYFMPSAQPEIVYCKDCVKHEQKGIWKEARNRMELCPLAIFRGAAQGHEFDYQYCCYGKRKGEENE